jgi:hypothetical protein
VPQARCDLKIRGKHAARIVSLYLATRDWRIRLRVSVGIRRLFRTGNETIDGSEIIVISVTNVGRRAAKITGLFWQNRLVLHRYGYQEPGDLPFSAQIPVKLNDGDDADFLVSLEQFKATADPKEFGKFFLPSPRLLTARFLRMRIRTSTGKPFRAKIEKELTRELIRWVQSAHRAGWRNSRTC